MVLCRSCYRLVGLDGRPHLVLNTPYETLELALAEASKTGATAKGLAAPLASEALL